MKRLTLVLLLILATPGLAAVPIPEGEAELPFPLRKIPSDATIFFHTNADTMWDHSLAVAFREHFGEDESRISRLLGFSPGVTPQEVKSVTGFYAGPMFGGPGRDLQMRFALLVTTREPYDQAKILGEWHTDGPPDERGMHRLSFRSYLHFTTPTVFAVVGEDYVEEYLKDAGEPTQEFVRMASQPSSAFVARVAPRELGLGMFAASYEEWSAFFTAQSVQLSAEVAEEQFNFRVILNGQDEEHGAQLEKIMRQLLELATDAVLQEQRVGVNDGPDGVARQVLQGLALDVLNSAQLTRQGENAMLNAHLDAGPKAIARIKAVAKPDR